MDFSVRKAIVNFSAKRGSWYFGPMIFDAYYFSCTLILLVARSTGHAHLQLCQNKERIIPCNTAISYLIVAWHACVHDNGELSLSNAKIHSIFYFFIKTTSQNFCVPKHIVNMIILIKLKTLVPWTAQGHLLNCTACRIIVYLSSRLANLCIAICKMWGLMWTIHRHRLGDKCCSKTAHYKRIDPWVLFETASKFKLAFVKVGEKKRAHRLVFPY